MIELLSTLQEDQETLFYWIKERELIRKRKEADFPKPWTFDHIFQHYKFCNVSREDDRVTKWIKDNWREPYRGHPNMWFAMIVARLFNWPPTLEAIGFPDYNEYASNLASFEDWKDRTRFRLKTIRDDKKEKVFTGAYLVSTNGVKMDKIDYILDRILTPLWNNSRSPQSLANTYFDGILRLEEYWNQLILFDGLGSFMAGQVVADLKYVDPVLEKASDWWTFAPLGPGSIRGLNRYFGRQITTHIKQEQGLKDINMLRGLIEDKTGLKLPAHDVQNCLCEYDKYLRLKKGQGKTRSGYNGVN